MIRRDRLAQPVLQRAEAEKLRIHKPLGKTNVLARHLILWGMAVPA
jgi:hypothetical protein